MKRITCLAIICAIGLSSLAQEDNFQKARIYHARIRDMKGAGHKGFLDNFADSAVYLSPMAIGANLYSYPQTKNHHFDYSQIDQLRLQRQGSIGRGILYGSLTGLLIGFIVGIAQGDDPPSPSFFGYTTSNTAFEKGLIGMQVGGLSGVIIGGVIGALFHVKFRIGGNREKYEDMRNKFLNSMYK